MDSVYPKLIPWKISWFNNSKNTASNIKPRKFCFQSLRFGGFNQEIWLILCDIRSKYAFTWNTLNVSVEGYWNNQIFMTKELWRNSGLDCRLPGCFTNIGSLHQSSYRMKDNWTRNIYKYYREIENQWGDIVKIMIWNSFLKLLIWTRERTTGSNVENRSFNINIGLW